jgi:hypothetical protein
MSPGDFPIGSSESRAAARMRLQEMQSTRKRIEFITNISLPHRGLSQAPDTSMPYAYPWQETNDGSRLRMVYCPGEWKKLPVETIPVCSGCGTPFRKSERLLSDWVYFRADCMEKHDPELLRQSGRHALSNTPSLKAVDDVL